MKILEAIRIGNEFIQRNIGVHGDPEFVRLVSHNGTKSWLVIYSAALIQPKLISAGTTIDDGEYALRIDCKTAEVTVVP